MWFYVNPSFGVKVAALPCTGTERLWGIFHYGHIVNREKDENRLHAHTAARAKGPGSDSRCDDGFALTKAK